MNDRAVSLLEQYDIEVLHTRKGRGAILCDTDRGCLIFKEYAGSENRVCIQNRLLNHIKEAGSVQTESILPTKEGELLVKDTDGTAYILKTYRDGRECNIYEKKECLEAVRLLAKLHRSVELAVTDEEFFPKAFLVETEYEKHNKELKRVRRFLKQRGQKTWFEICLMKSYDYFLEQALAITKEWKEYSLVQQYSGCQQSGCKQLYAAGSKHTLSFCHGDYQYHNILRDGNDWFIVNFEKCLPDSPIRDLYLFMRKLLEKSNWSVPLGQELLAAYEEECPISAMSRIDLYYRLAYPEKFWKIVNFYYNSGKAWIPERNLEKLQKLTVQEQEKQTFLDEVFRSLG